MSQIKWPIGVFASIDAGLGVNLDVARELEISTIQLHAPKKSTRTTENARQFLHRLQELEIQLTAVFGGFEGESYVDIPTVQRTVGLVPEQWRTERLAEMKEISDFARSLDCHVIGLHLGFVPHDVNSPTYADVVDVTRNLCEHAARNDQNVHLETGQESADALVEFMDQVDVANLFVNFDPANMILYGTGQPIEALNKLGSRVRSVHCKDAKWAANPGKEWGREVPLGEGDVDVDQYLQTLCEIGYDGPLTIEREIPQEPERQKTGNRPRCPTFDRNSFQSTVLTNSKLSICRMNYYRLMIGIFACVGLLVGTWMSCVDVDSNNIYAGIIVRIGMMLGVTWLAFPELHTLKSKASVMVMCVLGTLLLVLAARPRLFPICAIAAVFIIIVNGVLRRLSGRSR